MGSLNQSVNYNTEASICEVLAGRIHISLAFPNVHVDPEHLAQAWPLGDMFKLSTYPLILKAWNMKKANVATSLALDSVDFENQFVCSKTVVLNPGYTLESAGKDCALFCF